MTFMFDILEAEAKKAFIDWSGRINARAGWVDDSIRFPPHSEQGLIKANCPSSFICDSSLLVSKYTNTINITVVEARKIVFFFSSSAEVMSTWKNCTIRT